MDSEVSEDTLSIQNDKESPSDRDINIAEQLNSAHPLKSRANGRRCSYRTELPYSKMTFPKQQVRWWPLTIRKKVGKIIIVNGKSEWLPGTLNLQRAMEMVNSIYYLQEQDRQAAHHVLHNRYNRKKLRMDY